MEQNYIVSLRNLWKKLLKAALATPFPSIALSLRFDSQQ